MRSEVSLIDTDGVGGWERGGSQLLKQCSHTMRKAPVAVRVALLVFAVTQTWPSVIIAEAQWNHHPEQLHSPLRPQSLYAAAQNATCNASFDLSNVKCELLITYVYVTGKTGGGGGGGGSDSSSDGGGDRPSYA